MTKNPLGLWTSLIDGKKGYMGFSSLTGGGNAFAKREGYRRYSVSFGPFYDPYSYKTNRYVGPVNLVRWDDDL